MTLNITNGSTVTKPNGVDFLDEYSGHLESLFETGSRPLTAVGGTGDAVTATMALDLTAAGLVDGLCVSITWGAANTTNVTLQINGGAVIPVIDYSGTALVASALASGLTSVLRYTAGSWKILTPILAGGGAGSSAPYLETFTASGTFTKPTGFDDDTLVIVECWGAGGSGGRGNGAGSTVGGGGGGGYARKEMRFGDLPSSVTVTIGAGGTGVASNGVGNAGGNTTFGSLLTAYGGGRGGGGGGTSTAFAGGGGGGELGVGTNGGTGAGETTGGLIGGGGDGIGTSAQANQARTIWGGGGGGNDIAGGSAVYGGGGGGGVAVTGGTDTGAGASLHGGAGGIGADGTPVAGAGTAPGGGGGAASGGTSGAGARGECRIRIG